MKNQLELLLDPATKVSASGGARQSGVSDARRPRAGARAAEAGRTDRAPSARARSARQGAAGAREALSEARRRAAERDQARRMAREAALLAAAAQPRLPHTLTPEGPKSHRRAA